MTPSEFQASFPDGEFNSLEGSYIQNFLDAAVTMFNEARWGALYLEGLANYTAHSIVVSKARALRGINQMNTGNMTSKTVGPVSASYDGQLLNAQAKDTLMTTDYGRRYCELRDMVGLGGIGAVG